jgi:hypothetical protein
MKTKLRASQGMVDYFKTEQESILKESSQKTNIIDDWLDKNGTPEIAKQVEKEAKELCEQETLEEAAERFSEQGFWQCPVSFEKGAEWQMERSYSEEDMKQFGLFLGSNFASIKGKSIDELFEQFKKK